MKAAGRQTFVRTQVAISDVYDQSDVFPVTFHRRDGHDLLSPLLGQMFFIGDGIDNGVGGTLAAQAFHVPVGATQLALGFIDAAGQYGDLLALARRRFANKTRNFLLVFDLSTRTKPYQFRIRGRTNRTAPNSRMNKT